MPYRYVLLFLVSLSVYSVSAQTAVLNKHISLSLTATSLNDVLAKIEKIAKVDFAYKATAFDRDRTVSIHQNNATIADILKILLYDDGAHFSAIGNQIIIYQPQTTENFLVPNPNLEPVRDTVWTQVTNTVFVNDTNWVTVHDTLRVFDTIQVKKIVKERITYSKKEKLHFAELYYLGGFAPIQYDPGLSAEFTGGQCWQLENSAFLVAGKTSDSWELSSGVGFSAVARTFNYHTETYSQWIDTDSVLHSEIHIDSSFIAVPNVDTIWLVSEPRLNQYYSYTQEQMYDTLHEQFTQKQTALYVHIPVTLTWKAKLNRKTQFRASASVITSVLLGTKARKMDFAGKNSAAVSTLEFVDMSLSGSLSAGIGVLLDRHFTFTAQTGAKFAIVPLQLDHAGYARAPLQPFVQIGLQKHF